jgi:uncharacterized protein YecE (DUF72 family)
MHSNRSPISGECWIGTSGLVLPVPNKAAFPKAFRDQPRLAYYASLFNSLEVNSSFYRTPMGATFEKWAAIVPDRFQFTVKLSRDITHAKDFAYNPADIDIFIKAANHVGGKRGCLLMQFPPGLRRNEGSVVKLQELLRLVWQSDPEHSWKWAVEFRHPSWYEEATFQLLDKCRATLVLQDMPGSAVTAPIVSIASPVSSIAVSSIAVSSIAVSTCASDFIYIRFHGPAGDYRGGYPAGVLRSYAEKIHAWRAQGKDVYVYFNNTIGDAVANARSLMELVSRPHASISRQ